MANLRDELARRPPRINRRFIRRRHHQQGPERNHPVLECRRRTHVRLYRGRSHRAIHSDDHTGRSARRRRLWCSGGLRSGHSPSDHYETRRCRKDGSELLVPRSLTVSPLTRRRQGRGHRRVEDRPRCHRARTTASGRRPSRAEMALKLSEVGMLSSPPRSSGPTVVQKVTDAARTLTQAEFGVFFYTVRDPGLRGLAHAFHPLSGAPKEAFSHSCKNPRSTAVFAPTFYGEGHRSTGRCDILTLGMGRTRHFTGCRRGACRRDQLLWRYRSKSGVG